jgi:hypothetical protein
MADTKATLPAAPAESYPEPDERTERERELEALMEQREAKKIFLQVSWKAGVVINGTLYQGLVKVDQSTADEIARMCNARERCEVIGRYGDGNPGLHTVTGTHNIFGI